MHSNNKTYLDSWDLVVEIAKQNLNNLFFMVYADFCIFNAINIPKPTKLFEKTLSEYVQQKGLTILFLCVII